MSRPLLLGAAIAGALTFVVAGLAGLVAMIPGGAAEAPSPLRSATGFLSPALRAEQADPAANRGMVWVEEGARLWERPEGEALLACRSCHGEAAAGMRGVAARYPAVAPGSGTLLNLEGRINACRTTRQSAPALAYESEPLLALTAFIAFQSRGMPQSVAVDGAAASHFETGRRLYATRQGQLDLACGQCHDDNVGRKLRGDVISSGLGTGYPAYRLEWQGLGSLYRRLRACQIGVRAVEYEPGSSDHLALELYLAWRGRGEPMESPAIRR